MSEYSWAFQRVAVAFATHILKQRWARPFVEPARFERWDLSARWHAQQSKELDHFQRQMVLDEAGDWCALIGDSAGKTAYHRQHVEDILVEACGVIISVMYESVLRDFVRATGYPARQVEADGIHADQTLGDLLRAPEVRHVLGDGHVDMVPHVLVDPEHGMNLRNDVGHGTAHAGALSPERLLLVWLFMIRLTLIRPIEPDEVCDEDGVVDGDLVPTEERDR